MDEILLEIVNETEFGKDIVKVIEPVFHDGIVSFTGELKNNKTIFVEFRLQFGIHYDLNDSFNSFNYRTSKYIIKDKEKLEGESSMRIEGHATDLFRFLVNTKVKEEQNIIVKENLELTRRNFLLEKRIKKMETEKEEVKEFLLKYI